VVTDTKDKKAHGYNFTLLQWRVVDGIEQCSVKLLFRRTRQTSSDKSATASNAGRYLQGYIKERQIKIIKAL
jgi:hypothetical protein